MKVASGGELARFLLALKVSLAERDTAPTLVFDEVDSGVGGAVADAIGQRLARLAAKAQVLAVTHAPQVAARSNQHFRIVKNDVGKGERVATQVLALDAVGPARRDRPHARRRRGHRRGAGGGEKPDREGGVAQGGASRGFGLPGLRRAAYLARSRRAKRHGSGKRRGRGSAAARAARRGPAGKFEAPQGAAARPAGGGRNGAVDRGAATGEPRTGPLSAAAGEKEERMDRIQIRGGAKLQGSIPISGAKNAALPLMIASLLTDQTLTLENLPRLADVSQLVRILGNHGVDYSVDGKRAGEGATAGQTAHLRAKTIVDSTAPYELVSRMRASFWVIAPLIARVGEARVSLPGGCAIGTRPVDLLLMALEKLGAEIAIEGGYVVAKAPKGLEGRGNRLSQGDGRRHPCGDDGGGAGARLDADRQRGARAGGQGPRRLPRSRWARGSRARGPRRSRSPASRGSTARAIACCPTASKRAPTRPRWR